MSIQVTVRGAAEIARRFANTPARAAQLEAAFDYAQEIMRAAVVAETPVLTGLLAGSWDSEAQGGVVIRGVIGNPVRYAPYVEHGARGVPPVEMLKHGIDATRPEWRAVIGAAVSHLVELS